jgi:hypothetical protein
MLRGLLSIVALVMVCASSVVIGMMWVIPNTFVYTLVPVLQPLHAALACQAGETLEHEFDVQEGITEFTCVNASGVARNVNDSIDRPANLALGVLALGIALLAWPFVVAMRQTMRGESGAALQTALQQSAEQLRQLPTTMTETTSTAAATLNATGQQQLAQLDTLRQQGHITPEAYETAKQRILKDFAAK